MADFDIDESIDVDISESIETTSLDSSIDVMDSVDIPEDTFDAIDFDESSLENYDDINEEDYNSEVDEIMNEAEFENLEFESESEELPGDSLDIMDDTSAEELEFDDEVINEDFEFEQEDLEQSLEENVDFASVDEVEDDIEINDDEILFEESEQLLEEQFDEDTGMIGEDEIENIQEDVEISDETDTQTDLEQMPEDQVEEVSDELGVEEIENVEISNEIDIQTDFEQMSEDQVEEVTDESGVEEIENIQDDIETSDEIDIQTDLEQMLEAEDQVEEVTDELGVEGIENIQNDIETSNETDIQTDLEQISEDTERVDPHEALGSMSEYMNEHNYGLDDYETYSQDPEWQTLNRDLQIANGIEPTEYAEDIAEATEVEEVVDSHEALSSMNEYMNEHNYGLDDYETYSQDPEWQALNRDLQIANGIEPTEYAEDIAEATEVEEAIDPHEALNSMSEYMNEHNYGLDDYETYSQDPEWQALNRDLQIANGIETQDEGVQEILNEIENPMREFDDFERSVIDSNPDFYDTGSFYQQGINEFGFQGTCGPTSQANAINELLGTNELTENKVLSVAIDNNLCQTHGDLDSCGGTSTDQFMELYNKMNEQLGDKFDTELFEYGDVLDANQVADRLENGDVVNVAVDACTLWDMPRDYVNDLGVRQDDFYSDHWITVTGVQRLEDGTINGFDIIDSGGGENYVSLDKYNEMCFGTKEHRVIDPTCIVLSKKDMGIANSISPENMTEKDYSSGEKPGLFDRIFHRKGE